MRPSKPWDSKNHPIQKFRSEMDNLFSRFFEELPTPSIFSREESFTPKCNIEERSDHYRVEVELPGVKQEDVKIELEGDIITIKGERKKQVDTKDEENKIHIIEHSYGSFYRSFTIPSNVNIDEIKAGNENGILIITLPKDKKEQPRRITIE